MGNNKSERVKLRNRNKRTGLIINILLVLCIVYITASAVMALKNNVVTCIAENGSIEDNVTVDGYVYKDQTIINSPVDGYIDCEVADGERVKKDQLIMSIYQNEINSETNNRLKEINEKIETLSGNNLLEETYVNDTVRIEQEIADETENLFEYERDNNLIKVAELKKNINALIDKKRKISGEKKNDAEILAELKKEKEELKKKNNTQSTQIFTDRAGAFTVKIDGFEGLLNINALDELTPDYIRKLDKEKLNTEYNDKAKSGEPVCKIVDNFKWYFACLVDENFADSLTDSPNSRSVASMRFLDVSDDTINGVVYRKSDVDKGKVLLIIRSDKFVDSIYSTSKAEVEIIKKQYNGIKIPSESIRVLNQKKGVYIIKNGTARFVEVKILYNGKGWAVVSPIENTDKTLKVYDEVIVSARNLYDGKAVK